MTEREDPCLLLHKGKVYFCKRDGGVVELDDRFLTDRGVSFPVDDSPDVDFGEWLAEWFGEAVAPDETIQ